MSETVDIKINLSSTNWGSRYPGARVYIDEILIYENLIVEPTEVSWSGELNESEHKIIVEMYNKKDGDTVLDDQDNILNDVILNIDGISIDDIELDQIIWSKSVYYPNSEYAPNQLTDCVNLGWNGCWELTFSSPVYLWFLENL